MKDTRIPSKPRVDLVMSTNTATLSRVYCSDGQKYRVRKKRKMSRYIANELSWIRFHKLLFFGYGNKKMTEKQHKVKVRNNSKNRRLDRNIFIMQNHLTGSETTNVLSIRISDAQ